MQYRKVDCFSGTLFAAASLWHHGKRPLVVELVTNEDDGHILAVFKQKSYWGAIAKSNFTTLKFREPVYKTVRELVMSYFDFYFDIYGKKTLRKYSAPINLASLGNEWLINPKKIWLIR